MRRCVIRIPFNSKFESEPRLVRRSTVLPIRCDFVTHFVFAEGEIELFVNSAAKFDKSEKWREYITLRISIEAKLSVMSGVSAFCATGRCRCGRTDSGKTRHCQRCPRSSRRRVFWTLMFPYTQREIRNDVSALETLASTWNDEVPGRTKVMSP